MECKHEFQGHKDGVTCMTCGLKMDVDEYLNYLNSKEETVENTVEAEETKKKSQRKPRTQKGAK